MRLLDETVEVTKSSRKYKVTKFEYLMMQKVNQAMKGSRLHQNDTLKLALKAMDARVTIHKDVAWADCLQDMAMDCPESINPDILNEYLKNTKGKY